MRSWLLLTTLLADLPASPTRPEAIRPGDDAPPSNTSRLRPAEHESRLSECGVLRRKAALLDDFQSSLRRQRVKFGRKPHELKERVGLLFFYPLRRSLG